CDDQPDAGARPPCQHFEERIITYTAPAARDLNASATTVTLTARSAGRTLLSSIQVMEGPDMGSSDGGADLAVADAGDMSVCSPDASFFEGMKIDLAATVAYGAASMTISGVTEVQLANYNGS